jgi:galactoside 2-L-fucosyltransferase 1/2
MFIFASAYGLARAHGCRLHASKRIIDELSLNFNIQIKKDMWLNQQQVDNIKDFIVKDTVCTFLPDMLEPNAFKHIELRGYWQSYLYFDAYRDEIRELYTGRSDTLLKLSKYFFNTTKNDCQICLIPPHKSHNELRQFIRTYYNITWIGIHIRRWDFRVLNYASDEQYIYRAIAYYKRRYYNHKIRFLVASDDKQYCHNLFTNEQKSNQIFILPNYFTHADDLIALSFCHHSIVTGGTYSFWAGYLAGGEVIHDIMYKIECSRSDYYPPWFKLVGKPKSKVR